MYGTPNRTELTRRSKNIGPTTTVGAHVIANTDLFTNLNCFAGGDIEALHTAAMIGCVEVVAISTDDGKEATKK